MNFFDAIPYIANEIQKIESLENEDLAHLIGPRGITEFRKRVESIRSAKYVVCMENPDVYFKGCRCSSP